MTQAREISSSGSTLLVQSTHVAERRRGKDTIVGPDCRNHQNCSVNLFCAARKK